MPVQRRSEQKSGETFISVMDENPGTSRYKICLCLSWDSESVKLYYH